MSLKKQYLKTKPECKVTFKAEKQLVQNARKACISGDFNDWKVDGLEMKKMKNGDCSVSLSLPVGQDYRYKFVFDGCRWEADQLSDRHESDGFSGSNSVVSV